MKIKLLFLSFCIAFSACQSDWKAVEKLEAEVVAIHDVPMQKLDELEKLKHTAAEISSKLDSNSVEKKSLLNFVTEAEKANNEMFDWMNQFQSPDKEKTTADKAILYLTDQKVKAEKMSKQVLSAIENGKKLTANK